MNRLLAVVTVVLMCASSAVSAPAAPARTGKSGKIPAPEALRTVAIDKVERGMRVKLELTYARPMIGTVNLVTPSHIGIDLTTEPDGLPGKMRFLKNDIMLVWELTPQTDDEKRLVLERRNEAVAKMKIEMNERAEKTKSEEATEEDRAKTEAEGIRKAMDVVVAKEDEDKMRALLEEYPPEEWGEATFREVRENWILRDLQPTPKQSRFLIIFDEWKTARDTIAALDAKEKQKAGEQMLIKFPPSEGWGKGRLDAIEAKELGGEPLTEDETEFKKSWKDWSAAATSACRGRASTMHVSSGMSIRRRRWRRACRPCCSNRSSRTP